jgi:hypothetical protein
LVASFHVRYIVPGVPFLGAAGALGAWLLFQRVTSTDPLGPRVRRNSSAGAFTESQIDREIDREKDEPYRDTVRVIQQSLPQRLDEGKPPE